MNGHCRQYSVKLRWPLSTVGGKGTMPHWIECNFCSDVWSSRFSEAAIKLQGGDMSTSVQPISLTTVPQLPFLEVP